MKIKPLVDKWVENEEFMQADITIKEAASQMGTNSNYLSLYMNKYLNTSFSTWLNTLRIEKSKYYLTKPGKLSIEECGIKVGYPNIYNYSRWFKIVTGMSPSEWRKIQ
jgi:YesN/AraC family two-component response regulator